MAINFKQIQGIVEKEIIKPLGENLKITLVQPATTDFDAANPQDGPATTPINHVVNAVLPKILRSNRRFDALDLSRGAFTILVSGLLTVEPTVGWLAIVRGITYRITDVDISRPGSTVLLYTLTAER